MSRSSFSKAYEEITKFESMEMTFTIKDADLDKLNEVLKDINVKECPWFEVQDKHGNKAKYYREPHWIPVMERLPDEPNIYTVTDSKGDVVRFAFYNNKSSREYWRRCAKAWMPLPEPYQAERREG